MESKFGFRSISGVSIASVVLVLLASCSNFDTPPMKSNIKKFDISFQAKGNPKKLEFGPDTNSKCKNPTGGSNAKYGCISTGFGEQATITFRLKTGSWHMTEIVICKGAEKATQVCKLSVAEQNEFAFMEIGGVDRYFPDENGVINISKISDKVSEFMLIDFNHIPTPGDYFYSLKACKDGTVEDVPENCAETDPPIKNGGRQLHN